MPFHAARRSDLPERTTDLFEQNLYVECEPNEQDTGS